jgi:hypothetical protein
MKMTAITPTTIGTNLGGITVTTENQKITLCYCMITLGYWRTRAGDKVRVICVDGPGEYPVISVNERGAVDSYRIDGLCYGKEEESEDDLFAPWVDPPKVAECWIVTDSDGRRMSWLKEDAAKLDLKNHGGTIHHMREVNPAREATLKKLVAATREWASGDRPVVGNFTRIANALAELDKAGGL